jgi:hypothetical protein
VTAKHFPGVGSGRHRPTEKCVETGSKEGPAASENQRLDLFTSTFVLETMAVAEGFEPSACPRSERRNACDLRNNIICDSLGFPRFVPKCAQNVPSPGQLSDEESFEPLATCVRTSRTRQTVDASNRRLKLIT